MNGYGTWKPGMWDKVTQDLLSDLQKWREDHPEEHARNQELLADKRYRENQARRKCLDTSDSVSQEIQDYKMGY